VKYISPSYGGFSFGGIYAFGNEAGSFATNRAWNVGASYKHGAFSIAAAYEALSQPAGNTTGAVGMSGTSGSDYPSLPALYETGTVLKQQIAVVSGNYQIGKFTVGATYSHVRFDVTTSPVKLHVLGMSCPKCVSNVDIQLMRVSGVQKAQIDMGSGIVVVDFDPSKKITRAALAKAVDDSGLTIASIEGK
jgi:predicted porin